MGWNRLTLSRKQWIGFVQTMDFNPVQNTCTSLTKAFMLRRLIFQFLLVQHDSAKVELCRNKYFKITPVLQVKIAFHHKLNILFHRHTPIVSLHCRQQLLPPAVTRRRLCTEVLPRLKWTPPRQFLNHCIFYMKNRLQTFLTKARSFHHLNKQNALYDWNPKCVIHPIILSAVQCNPDHCSKYVLYLLPSHLFQPNLPRLLKQRKIEAIYGFHVHQGVFIWPFDAIKLHWRHRFGLEHIEQKYRQLPVAKSNFSNSLSALGSTTKFREMMHSVQASEKLSNFIRKAKSRRK